MRKLIFLLAFMALLAYPVMATTQQNILINNNTAFNLGSTPSNFVATCANQTWLYFNGQNNYVTLPLGSYDLNFSRTISFWINITENDTTNIQKVIARKDMTNSQDIDVILLQNISALRFSIGNQTAFVNVTTGFISQNIWHHVAFTVFRNATGVNMTSYLDGVWNSSSLGAITGGEIVNTTAQFTIGAPVGITSGVNLFNGTIDELRIYNDNLTSARVSAIFNSGRLPNVTISNSNLSGWYSFNENTGTTIYDKLGVANGTINGASFQIDRNISIVASRYSLSGTTVTFTDANLAWTLITVGYDVLLGPPTLANAGLCSALPTGLGNVSNAFVTILTLLGIILILSFIGLMVYFFYNSDGGFDTENVMDTSTKFVIWTFVFLIIAFVALLAVGFICAI